MKKNAETQILSNQGSRSRIYYTCFNGFLKCILLFWKKCSIIRTIPSETVRYWDLHSWRLLNSLKYSLVPGPNPSERRRLGTERGSKSVSDKLDRWRHIRNRQGRLGMRLFVMHLPFLQLEQHFLPAARSSGFFTFWLFQVVFIRGIEVWIFDVCRHLQNADLRSRVV